MLKTLWSSDVNTEEKTLENASAPPPLIFSVILKTSQSCRPYRTKLGSKYKSARGKGVETVI